jgi:hypothetical protein
MLRRLTVAALLALTAGAGTAPAQVIPVANNSFETPVTDRNGTGSITGWTRSNLTGGASGIWRPNVGAAGADFNLIPDGSQVAFVQTGDIFQPLPNVLAANTRYDLLVDVGQDLLEPLLPGQFAVELRASGSVLATASAPTPAPARWNTVAVSYTALPGDPLLGQSLEIRLRDLNPSVTESDVNFDNVRVTMSPVPEPSSLALLALAAAGTAVRAGRRCRLARSASLGNGP